MLLKQNTPSGWEVALGEYLRVARHEATGQKPMPVELLMSFGWNCAFRAFKHICTGFAKQL